MNNTSNPHRRSGIAMLVVAWLLLFGGGYWFFENWSARQYNPNADLAQQQDVAEVVLKRNRQGHYVAGGEINGQPVTFLLDTGASQIALSTRLARELGLKFRGEVTVQTANGYVSGFQTRLESVRLGSIELRDVAALAADGIDYETVLLGMSFLRRVEFSQRGSLLTLKPIAD
ncbi:MAG: TIGR02281 family clan AA aspartic protease [Burkholderiales bacterium]|nr:TIGR02281 family clan AA aspartic protease [Burkholderiales bacterium]